MPKEPTPAIRLCDGDLEAFIQPEQGGRVLGFHGDTFWPSPQERFDWPPPAILDEDPYTVIQATGKSATIQSARDEPFGFQLEKHFEVKGNAIHFTSRLTNIWDRPQYVAPWQVTRAPREGKRHPSATPTIVGTGK